MEAIIVFLRGRVSGYGKIILLKSFHKLLQSKKITTEGGIGSTEVHGEFAPWTSVLPIPPSVVKKALTGAITFSAEIRKSPGMQTLHKTMHWQAPQAS